MRTRVVCLPPSDIGTGVARLSQLAFYLHDVDVEEIILMSTDSVNDTASIASAVVESAPDNLGQQYRKFTESVSVCQPPDAAVTNDLDDGDAVIVWWVGPEDDRQIEPDSTIPTLRIDAGDSRETHQTLLRLAASLRGTKRREAAASLRRMRTIRDQIETGAISCVLLGAPAGGIDANQLLIASAELDPLDLSAYAGDTCLLVTTEPDIYLPSPTRSGVPPPLLDERVALLVPAWVSHEMARAWPEYRERIIGIPNSESGSDYRQLAIAESGPIGPSTLIPLAGYLASEIHIIADDPVLGSDAEWEAALLAVEKRGVAITVCGSTNRREFARRAVRDVEAGKLATTEIEFLLISVNPDWVDDMGHHAHFDRALGKAVRSSGGMMVSLTSASLHSQQSENLAIFSHPTFGYDTSEAAIFLAAFERELRNAIEHLAAEFVGIPIRVAMYSAGIPQLSAIVSVAAAIDDPRIAFYVNLLRAHNELLDMEQDSNPSLASLTLQAALDVGPTVGVHTMADTDEIGDMLESLFGHRLAAWPMIGVTDLEGNHEIRPPTTPPTACYPATQEIKGLPLFAMLAERIAATSSDAPVRFTARDTGHHPDWTGRLAAAGVELHSGVLTPAEYARFMESSDIILLPYRSRPFLIQTSGVFADAVRLRKPVVATRSTWAGRLIREHGIGATFEESDLEGFANALTDVVENFDEYQQRMIEFAPGWLSDNNPQSLLNAFAAVDSGRSTHRPDSSGVELLAALTRVTALETQRIVGRKGTLHRPLRADRRGSRCNG